MTIELIRKAGLDQTFKALSYLKVKRELVANHTITQEAGAAETPKIMKNFVMYIHITYRPCRAV